MNVFIVEKITNSDDGHEIVLATLSWKKACDTAGKYPETLTTLLDTSIEYTTGIGIAKHWHNLHSSNADD